jgi:beta-barrel assembly-enhancing protease
MKLLAVFVILFGFGFPAGCADVVRVGTSVGQGMGYISPEQKDSYDRLAVSTEKAARPMTEKEEDYVGRAVAATLLGKYRLNADPDVTRYVNEVGQAVALASDRPLTFGGYHFAVLDTEEENALSCPGGIILITRGMLRTTRNEEELAAILAHEVAHVNHKDGLAAIQKSRWVEVATLMGSEAAKQFSGADLTHLVSLFEGSVNDVVKTLVVNGYSREQESAADLSALTFLVRAGYDPRGLTNYLETIAAEQSAGAGSGIFATHPGMAERLVQAQEVIAENRWPQPPHAARDKRFRTIVN